ncbi:MAG: hypothetical protein ABH864_01835 [archaeon]
MAICKRCHKKLGFWQVCNFKDEDYCEHCYNILKSKEEKNYSAKIQKEEDAEERKEKLESGKKASELKKLGFWNWWGKKTRWIIILLFIGGAFTLVLEPDPFIYARILGAYTALAIPIMIGWTMGLYIYYKFVTRNMIK